MKGKLSISNSFFEKFNQPGTLFDNVSFSNRSQISQNLAVLIDADNISSKLIAPLLEEISKYGTANVKRIYGDWTSSHLKGWKERLHEFAIQPIQQYSYTSGKNATDSALIIDAMDLLYTNNFDGFCIVSSDSDYTRLACRLREAGLFVYGFGERKTPIPFQKACDKFTYVEILSKVEPISELAESTSILSKVRHFNPTFSSQKIELVSDLSEKPDDSSETDRLPFELIEHAYEAIADEDGWANLAPVGGQINKVSPSFDPRNYGYNKLGKLIESLDLFEMKEVASEHNPVVKVLYIKKK
ncbi:NYN domain-containing protein [Oscillatoriales cyanobacterium LEGE 11467]|uniref:NYN domain-containing protein n=1 Tax=Zarconia navalis LEGE 11467 TaxID=1828826 RepID=A0A928VZZ1_9CYAN|nr:NYN domain-containing protein [Zarconia navalis]MBE9040775.1 NYN domain-containing protein [Zarconia navalis LEGE 11467]